LNIVIDLLSSSPTTGKVYNQHVSQPSRVCVYQVLSFFVGLEFQRVLVSLLCWVVETCTYIHTGQIFTSMVSQCNGYACHVGACCRCAHVDCMYYATSGTSLYVDTEISCVVMHFGSM
jgi:hypothetical protein